MPARGDHEQRRRDVARIAADLVATGGLAAATHRRIAEASGCSTTVVSHYFTDKRDLVNATYTEVGDRVSARLEPRLDSADPLLSILEALLPLDEDRDPRLAAPVHLPRPGRHRRRAHRRAALPRHHGTHPHRTSHQRQNSDAGRSAHGHRRRSRRTVPPGPRPRHRYASPLRPDRLAQ